MPNTTIKTSNATIVVSGGFGTEAPFMLFAPAMSGRKEDKQPHTCRKDKTEKPFPSAKLTSCKQTDRQVTGNRPFI